MFEAILIMAGIALIMLGQSVIPIGVMLIIAGLLSWYFRTL